MNELEALRPILDAEQIPRLDQVAGNVDAPTVDRDVPVHDHLPGCRAGRSKPDSMNDVVETALEKRHERFTGVALPPLGPSEVSAELPLQNPVVMLHLLLLAKMKPVLGRLAATLLDHTRRSGAAFERTLPRVTAAALEEELEAITTAKATDRPSNTSHGFPAGVLTDRSRGDSDRVKMPDFAGVDGGTDQTRRFFGGRHPLWGSGVMSSMLLTFMPAA